MRERQVQLQLLELALEQRVDLLEPAHQLHEGAVEALHLLGQVWWLQLLARLQLLAALLRERLDWEDVDALLQDRLEADADELGPCRAVLVQQRQEQLELLEAELEDRLHASLQRLCCVELVAAPVLRCVRLQLLLRRELLELLPRELLRQEQELEELQRGPREHDAGEEALLVCGEEQEEDLLLPELPQRLALLEHPQLQHELPVEGAPLLWKPEHRLQLLLEQC
ncbi:hypothetical protein [Mumia zhuanghuii]|uniref:Uncharacterized protein n=1 Tax=Mumia zhuanghuii TaxID=2585211 RepID=A0A5C4LVV9_9ACTN|nr:hypothetical protein [Mumia zhuanghuii]TNC22439.1 hypothetical protein FHE65_35755 [Mumia zhuanghuii]